MRLFLLLFLLPLAATAQLTGTVLDENNEPLPFASVYVRNSTRGVTSNAEGRFRLPLEPGNYQVVFHYIGYQQKVENVTVGPSGANIIVRLDPTLMELAEVVITGRDPAYAIMKEAISRRKYYRNRTPDYSCDVYIKGLHKLLDAPKKILGQDVGDLGGILDTNRTGVLYLSESVSRLDVQSNPDRTRETMISSKVSGDENGFSMNRATLTELNLYEERIEIEREILSPLADNAFQYYDFRLEGSYENGNGFKIYKIKLLPKRPADPSFGGDLHIVDNYYNIAGADLTLTGSAIKQPILDTLRITQEFVPLDQPDQWALLSQLTAFQFGILGFKIDGSFNTVFSNYNIKPDFGPDFFSREVFRIEPIATERDSNYWQKIRPIPLTGEEQNDYVRKDSLRMIWESDAYRDSVDRKNNRIKPLALLFGYTWSKSKTNTSVRWPPVFQGIQFNTVQGFAVNLQPNFRRDEEKTRNFLEVESTLNYGLSEERFRGALRLERRFESIHYTELEIAGGMLPFQLDENRPIGPLVNSLYSLIDRRNYLKLYEKAFLRMEVRRTLTPALRLRLNAEYAYRSPLANTTEFSWYTKPDHYYSVNGPRDEGDYNGKFFTAHQAAFLGAEATIRFGARYSSYPGFRSYYYRHAPVLRITLRQAVPIAHPESPDFLFAKIGLAVQGWSWGLAGYSNLSISTGGFLYRNAANFIDAYHPSGNQTFIAPSNRGIMAFYLLPYYERSTFDAFAELHWQHHLQGWLLDKIPLIRKLNWKEVVTVNGFYARDAALTPFYADPTQPWTELAFGFENIGIKAFRPLRIDFAAGFEGLEYRRAGVVLTLGF